jgi:hypothetical protein
LANVAALFLTASSVASAADDIVIADFEGDTYGERTATGDAFGSGPARGPFPGQMPVSAFAGQSLVNTFRGGDGTTENNENPRSLHHRAPHIPYH